MLHYIDKKYSMYTPNQQLSYVVVQHPITDLVPFCCCNNVQSSGKAFH